MNDELKIYHGSDVDFERFDAAYIKNTLYGWGFSFTTDTELASDFGDIIYTIEIPKDLKLLDFDNNDEFDNIYKMFVEDIESFGISEEYVDLKGQDNFRDLFWMLQLNYHNLLGMPFKKAIQRLTDFLKELGYGGSYYRGIYVIYDPDDIKIVDKKPAVREESFNFSNITKTILQEYLSNMAYHFTTLYNAYEMVTTDTIKMTEPYTDSDREIQAKHGKKYFLSTTRVKDGRFGYSKGYNVRIELNSDAFNSNFSAKPVSFFKDSKLKAFNQDDDSYVEAEDRVFSNSHYLHNISRFITRIDIFIPIKTEDIYNIKNMMRKKWHMLETMYSTPFATKIFVYNDMTQFNKQGKNITEEILETL